MVNGINFNRVPCIYWSDRTKVSYLQRRILVYSIMYYQLNESCVPDHVYEAIVRQLVKIQNEIDPEEFKKTTYYYVMHDFNGSTGFDLFYKLKPKDREYLLGIAKTILKQWRKEK